MLTPRRPEIDHRTLKLIVGVVAIGLASLTNLFAKSPLTSISASYYEGGWSQGIFIGFLFAIAAFLLAYNGRSRTEMVLSKIASIAGVCVALFPCGCDGHDQLVPGVHYTAAAVMFLVLADFSYMFYRRAKAKRYKEASVRAGVYALCTGAILLSILVLAVNGLSGDAVKDRIPYVTFYGEAVGLVAFGISWLVASHVVPVINREEERFSLVRQENPESSVEVTP